LPNVAALGQPIDVVPDKRCKHVGDRRQCALGETPATKDHVDECAPRHAIAVHEGMDGLELGMRNCCLSNGWEGVIVRKLAMVPN
jgi:hypothetical protein